MLYLLFIPPHLPTTNPAGPGNWLLSAGAKLQITGEKKTCSWSHQVGKEREGQTLAWRSSGSLHVTLPPPKAGIIFPTWRSTAGRCSPFGNSLKNPKCHFLKPPSPPTITYKTRHLLPRTTWHFGCQQHMPSGTVGCSSRQPFASSRSGFCSFPCPSWHWEERRDLLPQPPTLSPRSSLSPLPCSNVCPCVSIHIP